MPKNTHLCGQPVLCQLLSFIPKNLVDESVHKHNSDYYYKTMTSYKQLVFLLYGVITRCNSLNNLCKNLLFLEDKLTYLGIDKLPASSTLSDANKNRKSDIFGTLYSLLYQHYYSVLNPRHCSFLEDKLDLSKVSLFDSSTISLFVDVFKGAGRNALNGKKKGGLKIHAKLPLGGLAPDLIHLTEAACSDKSFLGQLNVKMGDIYVFDKGYVNYKTWGQWSQKGAFFVTRLNENADYQVVAGVINHISEYADGGIVSDQTIVLNPNNNALKARLIVYIDPQSGEVLKFVSNMFDYEDRTIIQLYKYRWNIEVLFKRLKQNFELTYFFSDSPEGIKTQIWIALIGNLIFSVIHSQSKKAELFGTVVSLASNNMGSYISLIKLIKTGRLSKTDRDISLVQLKIFEIRGGGTFENLAKPYP